MLQKSSLSLENLFLSNTQNQGKLGRTVLDGKLGRTVLDRGKLGRSVLDT